MTQFPIIEKCNSEDHAGFIKQLGFEADGMDPLTQQRR